MAEPTGTLEQLAEEIAAALMPLEDLLEIDNLPFLLRELGLDHPVDLGGDPVFAQTVADAVQHLLELPAQVEELVDAIIAEDVPRIITAASNVFATGASFATAMDAVATDLVRTTAGSPNADAIAAFAAQLVERLLEASVIRHLEQRRPGLVRVGVLLGLIESELLPDTIDEIAVRRRRLHLGRLRQLVEDPLAYARTTYGWGDATLRADLLFKRLSGAIESVGIAGNAHEVDEDAPEALHLFSLDVGRTTDPALQPPGLQGEMNFDVELTAPLVLAQLGESWRLELGVAAPLREGLILRLLPPARLEAEPPSAESVSGRVSLSLIGENPAPPERLVLLGTTGGSRLEAERVEVSAGVDLRWDAATTRAQGDAGAEARLVRGRLVIDASSSDGFLSRLLPAGGLAASFDVGIGWTVERGFFFLGGSGLEITSPLTVSVGPVHVRALRLALRAVGDGARLETGFDLDGAIGPVVATIEHIGIKTDVAFRRGNLGPIDLGVGFLFPRGAGIVIDAGPVTGGGFLSIDTDAGRYSGALQLRIYEISVSAFGVVDTRLPGGEKGFSFIILISAEFTPIQLGLGFTLNGVGGAIGIHRTLSKEALDGAVRSGRLEHILFPKDPAARAPEIIQDLAAYFPPAQGRYTFGPLAKIGWGTPNVLEAKVGLILELPHPVRLTLLGTVSAGLPSVQKRLVKLNLAVLGQLDFEKKTFALDASLYDSEVGGFTLSGDAAMRLAWGRDPSFALAIGGFNPQYEPPVGFPALRRITVDIGSGGNPRITCQAYLAVTPNTAQVGARAELTAGGRWNIYGWIGFDAICTFSPFAFRSDFSAGVALRQGTKKRASVTVHGALSGPNPWYVKGKACVSCFFFDICVGFDVTLSEKRPEQIPALPDLLTVVLAPAVDEVGNWSTELPHDADRAVALAARDDVVFDPLGAIVLRQSALPLEERISRYAGQTLGKDAIATYDIPRVAFAEPGGGETVLPDHEVPVVTDRFARAQFQELPDSKKLSLPQYEPMAAGVRLASDALRASTGRSVTLQYDTFVMNSADGALQPVDAYTPGDGVTEAHARGSAAATSAARTGGARKYTPALTATPPRVTLAGEAFTIASTARLDPVQGGALGDALVRARRFGPVPRGKVHALLAQHLEQSPAARADLQVVPEDELAA